uniref:Integrase, catalytic region, zinc finger, CCHC-type, peptidase aspartic, catalytic n=1 Tax=Tanacetum cinerariifolium TaxID=118510 RepID=A0A6L2L5E2_TANCI|nr:integrase, catalytic region, zinc finger, CCHC-type, peptidase aspartic, catalytic [Tanacetum cinerariifolium]
MANLSDDIQCAGSDHDHYQEAACAHHEDHMMHDSVQLDHVDSHADYTSDSNIILYDQEETLKGEFHSIKLQLTSTINYNKLIVEEASFLKRDFKQKENKFFEDFLDMKSLKEKVEDKLIKQDQSLQTVHMLCRSRPNPNELNRVAIGYKNPLCLTRAKQVQPALYNGHEIIKDNHKPTIVHDTEDTLEIAEITRKKINDRMNDPECVTHVFEELEAEVAQYAVDRKRDAIELKNLLIANDHLIAECLSQEVFCVATNSELNVAQFTKMCVANTIAEARCLALKAELANLRDTNNHDNQKELINHFSKLETTDSYITKLTDQVTHLQAQNDLFRAKNDKIKQHYKELYDFIKITRAKHIEQVTKFTTKNVNLKTSVSKATVNPQVSTRDKHATDVEPIIPRLRNNRDAHLDYLRHLKGKLVAKKMAIPNNRVVANQIDLVSNKFVTQSMTTTLSIEIESLIEGESNFEIYDTNQASQNREQSNKMADLNAPSGQTLAMAPPLCVDDQILPHIRCQLDEQWFVLTKETLREALHITPVNNDQAFAAPLSIDGLIDFVNQLGYPKLVKNLSNVVTNDLFQPWKAILTIINLYLTRKTSGFERPRAPVLHILWGVVIRTNIDYAKRIWEEFTQSIHTFIEDKQNLFHLRPDSSLHLANEEPILRYLKFSTKGTKREVFGMPIPSSLITAEIQQASYYQEYLAKVAQHRREPESGKYQPLPEVPGKGKAKVTEEQVAHDLLSLQKHKKTSPADQYIFQSQEESKKVVLRDEEGGQDKGQAGPDPDAQAEDQTGSDVGAQAKDQTRSDAGAQAEALEKSINRDHSEELAQDLAEARKKKKKSHESPKTPPGSPSHQPPPPLPAGSAAPSPSKTTTSAEYQAWMTTDIRLKPSNSLTPADLEMDEDMTPDEQAQSSNDEDIKSAHILTVNLRQGWWKPFKEERPATSKPAWSILSSDVPIPTNNWASALASNYSPPPEDSLLAQTGPAYEIIKVFHSDVIHLQYQMEECHKLLTDSMDDPILRHNVSKPLPLGGPPGQVTIQSDFFFNKDLEYLRYGSKGRRPALSISKMMAAYYPDAELEQMVPDQFWIEEECKYDIAAMYEDFQLGIESYQTQLNLTKPQWDATGYEYKHDYTVINSPMAAIFRDKYGVQMMTHVNEIHKFSDGTLQQIDEALDYRIKEFRINRMNPAAFEDKEDLP